jgi:1-acyl-sn-glycerol-3-phosphate acyltransferase
VPDDESIVLDTFKDGAFRLAIEHKIPIIPITFADNKKRFSFTFFSGKPGKLRVKVHKPVQTCNLTIENKTELKNNVRNIILEQLYSFNN